MPPVATYKSILCHFMSWLHNCDPGYPVAHVFSMEELNAVTTADVVRWFSVKCYGNPDPGENENPTICRSTILF